MATKGRRDPTFWQTKQYLLVAAIDFGTAYTGWAFSFRHDYERDPTKIQTAKWGSGKLQSSKAPSCILIEPDGDTFDSFGYEAEEKYSELASEGRGVQWFFFRNFKMVLHGKGVHRHTQLRDVSGKKLTALKVFGLCVCFLKNSLFKICNDRVPGIQLRDIQWVLTVPAIWDDVAKQFMREAAVFAGIDTESLSIALEPECASICCRHVPMTKGQSVNEFPAGTKYLVVDAGGGTVDIITHQVQGNGNLKECSKPSGGEFGGNLVNDAFMKFMDKYFELLPFVLIIAVLGLQFSTRLKMN